MLVEIDDDARLPLVVEEAHALLAVLHLVGLGQPGGEEQLAHPLFGADLGEER